MGRVLIKSQTHRDQNILQQSSGEEAKLMTGKPYYIAERNFLGYLLIAMEEL